MVTRSTSDAGHLEWILHKITGLEEDSHCVKALKDEGISTYTDFLCLDAPEILNLHYVNDEDGKTHQVPLVEKKKLEKTRSWIAAIGIYDPID
jgi:hypothetical protein